MKICRKVKILKMILNNIKLQRSIKEKPTNLALKMLIVKEFKSILLIIKLKKNAKMN